MSIKHFSILLTFILTCGTVRSQIGETRADIIEAFGEDYSSGTGDFNSPYISYADELKREDNSVYELISTFYFITMDNGEQRCTHMKFIYPISERASLEAFNDKTFIKMDSITWQDSATQYLYKLEERYPFCSLMVWLGIGKYSYSELAKKSN
jgi:hypothetical protein